MFGQTNRSFAGAMLVAVGVLGVSTSASASVIEIFGDRDNSARDLADFTGTLTYDFVLGDTGQLTVDLTNQVSPDFGGFLTAFVFSVASVDSNISAVLTSTTNAFFSDAQDQMAGSFGGPYLGGAGLNGGFLGGGDPRNGIGRGESGTFTFDITASDAESLSAVDFIVGGPLEFNFLARFRGVGDNGRSSDMVPGEVVPAPGVLALLGIAALGQRRRRRSA